MSSTSRLLFPHLGQPGSKLPLWTMQKPGVCALGLESSEDNLGSGSPQILTYFQPSVVLQLSQKMSATEWSPVSRRRCSAGPQPTLTLSRETRTQHTVGLLCQSQPTQKDFYLGGGGMTRASTPLGSVLGPSLTPHNLRLLF